MRIFLARVVSLSLLLLPRGASAKEAIKVELIPKAQVGQGQPELVVHAEQALVRLVLDVVRSSDEKRLKLQAGPLAAGREHRFPLELKSPGSASFEGHLSVVVEGGQTAEMPIQVSAELLAPIALSVAPEEIDLPAHTLMLGANREVERVEVSITSDTGAPLGSANVEVGGKADARGRYPVTWTQASGTVLSVALKAYDRYGFFGGVELFPWRVDIPHEEVQFATGSAEVGAKEAPKLEASFALIQDAMKKYGKLAPIKLFVAGHTDRVGDAGSNRTLSRDRARALGLWFRKRGVRVPIACAGFGEDKPAVETPDETDEARNRRAEYIVAVEPPAMGAAFVPLD